MLFQIIADRLEVFDVFHEQLLHCFLKSGSMCHCIAQSNWLRIGRRNFEIEIVIHVTVKVELALFDQLHDRCPGEQLRD